MYKALGILLYGVAIAIIVFQFLYWIHIPDPTIAFYRNLFVEIWLAFFLIMMVIKLVSRRKIDA